MNPKKKWTERHGRVVRNRRSRSGRRSFRTLLPAERNALNRRVRRRDAALLHHGRWDDFNVRVMRDAAWYW